MKTLIVIPARYGSTRLPGKPLALIAGRTLLERVVKIAALAAHGNPDIQSVIATDDARIGTHADSIGAKWVMTSPGCPTGTDRVCEAMRKSDFQPDFIINLQGDAPFTPPDFLKAMIASYSHAPCDLVTPVTQLSWEELDTLRDNKKATPFSGTTALFDEKTGLAHWFSKNILPAIRKEKDLRASSPELSPVWRHIGLYGYARKMLETFVTLPEGKFEALEGLEQLRVLENGYNIRCVPVNMTGCPSMSGVDSPEDIARAEATIARYGDPFDGSSC